MNTDRYDVLDLQPDPLESENCFEGWTTDDLWQFCLNCYNDFFEDEMSLDRYKELCEIEFHECVEAGDTEATDLEEYVRETAAGWVDIEGYEPFL